MPATMPGFTPFHDDLDLPNTPFRGGITHPHFTPSPSNHRCQKAVIQSGSGEALGTPPPPPPYSSFVLGIELRFRLILLDGLAIGLLFLLLLQPIRSSASSVFQMSSSIRADAHS
ncbi:hypothetical protein BT96DRAFT_996175 [Gymnopus androsaceus JB14]|uniref:Uncharacterized protein n=1 Tax=Gymnopus androsaceus JB14 TaxID=1447944 RepID=A0A6A4HEV3_9AGAR|nr:hypothetical protein BT96DRAFT_996175 [Gymnopus androsaceus JB14]